MSSPNAFDLIHDHLVNSWTETAIVFENEDFDLPDTPAHFVYVEVVGDTYEQDTFGAPRNNLWLEAGVVFLHVETPVGTGSAEARQISNRLTYLFREQPLAGIRFRRMSIGAGEPGKTFGNYFAMTVTIEWDRHDITIIP